MFHSSYLVRIGPCQLLFHLSLYEFIQVTVSPLLIVTTGGKYQNFASVSKCGFDAPRGIVIVLFSPKAACVGILMNKITRETYRTITGRDIVIFYTFHAFIWF